MSTLYWAEEKDPSDLDFYQVVVSDAWLNGAALDTALVEVEKKSGLQIGEIQTQNGAIRFQVGGGYQGTHRVLLTFSSQNRTLQRSSFLVVRES